MYGVTGKQCKIYTGIKNKKERKDTKVILGIYWSNAELL